MSFQINPSAAGVDIDCTTLVFYEMTWDEDIEPSSTVLKMHLKDGIGRINLPGLSEQKTDNDVEVQLTGNFPPLSFEQRGEMRELMQRWSTLNIPLRFLLFASKALIIEDSEEFIVLPEGERIITVGESD